MPMTLPERDLSGYGILLTEVSRNRQTFIAGAAITKGQAVYISEAGKVAPTIAGAKIQGIAEIDAAIDECVTVICGKGAHVTAQSAAAITAGAKLVGAADGKVATIAAYAPGILATDIDLAAAVVAGDFDIAVAVVAGDVGDAAGIAATINAKLTEVSVNVAAHLNAALTEIATNAKTIVNTKLTAAAAACNNISAEALTTVDGADHEVEIILG